MFVLVAADSALDREAVWERLERAGTIRRPRCRPRPAPAARRLRDLRPRQRAAKTTTRIARAAAARCMPRRPNSIAAHLGAGDRRGDPLLPANYYPVLTVMQLGAGQPSTILGGVEELITRGMYPLAALVFFASVAVPVLKLVGLPFMLIATQTGAPAGCATAPGSTTLSA